MRVGIVALVGCALVSGGCRQEAADAAATVADPVAGLFAAPPLSTGCQTTSSRYPWGKAALRTWTPTMTTEPENPSASTGAAYGAPFSARLVQAYGEDYGLSRLAVVLELADGCRKQFRADSFSGSDRAAIDAEVARHPFAPDPASYPIAYQDGLTSPDLVADGSLRVYTTQHFALWYGNATDGDFGRVIAQQGRTIDEAIRETAVWLEKQWLISRDVLHAPMPFEDGKGRHKLNIYLCGTGRPNADGDMGDCGAGAGEAMGISAWALEKGSVVISHEFGHMLQFYSGGFRDRPEAGVIWETGAQWSSLSTSPSINESHYYLDNLENGPLFSVARYASYPWMTYLWNKDETRDLLFDTWRKNLRDANGASQEDWLQTLVRLGQQSGAYPRGFVSFADDMGWYGVRLASMDFLDRSTAYDGTRPTRTTRSLGHFYIPLARVATVTDKNVYAPPSQRALLEWGTHLVPLTPTAGTVKVTLTGGTRANEAAWRFGIVAVKADGTPSYSSMGSAEGTGSGSTTLAVPADTKVYLAVTATPYRYETLGWQDVGQPVKGTRFPYRVKIEGATPRTGPVAACNQETAPGNWTLNYTLSGNKDSGRPCA